MTTRHLTSLSFVTTTSDDLGGWAMWRELLPDYVMLLVASGLSPNTIRLHRHYLAQLFNKCPDPYAVTTDDLVGLLSRESWGAESRKSARTVYRGFFSWAARTDRLPSNPAEGLPSIRVSPGAPRPTPEAIARAVVHGDDRRVAFMAMLASYCGLRAGEIAQVHENDYDINDLRLLVHGKGMKERTLPIVDLELEDRLAHVHGWAFPGQTDGHLSPGHVTKLLSAAMPGVWTAHTLRHRAGTNAYRGTRDVLAVSRMLGHARTETTQRYVQMDDAALLAAMQSAVA